MTARAPLGATLGLALALAAAPLLARAGDPARDAQHRLDDLERRIQLEDLRRGAPRTRAEDRREDLLRDREREAIEHGVSVRERMERGAQSLPTPAPQPAADASRAAFEQQAADLERRQRLERLQRDAERARAGPGAQHWPRWKR